MSYKFKHIVIADDDEDDVSLFQAALGETCPDLSLTVATDGLELIDVLKHIPKPDAILLDLNMPCKNGKECLIEIRTDPNFKDIPIVILSTSDRDADINYCLGQGADHYFVKPRSFEAMKSIVEKICNGELSA